MKLFVDNKRKPSEIYNDGKTWNKVETKPEFIKHLNDLIGRGAIPSIISFDYDLENEAEGLQCVEHLVNLGIKFKFNLPRVYLHCDDRALAIKFENILDEYTKKTETPYLFEYIKRF